MNRFRASRLLILAALAALQGPAREARAAAEVHRFNVVLSAMPSTIAADDFNSRLNDFNQRNLESFGLEGLEKIRFGWMFDAHLRYMVRQNVAVEAGLGQLRHQSKREFFPGINADIQLRTELLSVPVHVGGAFYMQPYNQGDFRARAYFGGGFISSVYNRARIGVVASGVDSAAAARANFEVTGKGDAPGFYLETGVHMYFASRFSVLAGLVYRDQKVRDPLGEFKNSQGRFQVGRLRDIPPGLPPFGLPLGGLKDLNLGGFGARMALAIGL